MWFAHSTMVLSSMVPPGSGTAFSRSMSDANWPIIQRSANFLLSTLPEVGLWPIECHPRLDSGTQLNEMFEPLASQGANVATRVTSQRSEATMRSSDSFISVG